LSTISDHSPTKAFPSFDPQDSAAAAPNAPMTGVVGSCQRRTAAMMQRSGNTKLSNSNSNHNGSNSSSTATFFYDLGRSTHSTTDLSDKDSGKLLVELPFGKPMTVLRATQELTRIIPRGSLKHNLTTYINSFTGTTATTAFAEHYCVGREEAEALGKSLYRAKIIVHVLHDHEFEDTSKYFYRLQCHQTPEILNSLVIWQDEKSLLKPSSDVMGAIHVKLQALIDKTTNSQDRVNYSHALKYHNDMLDELEYAICELQMVQMGRMDSNTVLAFGLNVFQLFIHFAFMKVGIPDSKAGQEAFWKTMKFNIGGNLYSLNSWWNGILRGNRRGPHGPAPFKASDSRMLRTLPNPVDPRVHFAAAATHFVRPLLFFNAQALDRELDQAAMIYCEREDLVSLDTATNRLTLSPLFQKYTTDFASSIKALPKEIMVWLPADKKAHIESALMAAKKIKVVFDGDRKAFTWQDYAGDYFRFERAPEAEVKGLLTKRMTINGTEVKREIGATSDSTPEKGELGNGDNTKSDD